MLLKNIIEDKINFLYQNRGVKVTVEVDETTVKLEGTAPTY